MRDVCRVSGTPGAGWPRSKALLQEVRDTAHLVSGERGHDRDQAGPPAFGGPGSRAGAPGRRASGWEGGPPLAVGAWGALDTHTPPRPGSSWAAETRRRAQPSPLDAAPDLASKAELSSVRFSTLTQELFFCTNSFCLSCPASPSPWLPACLRPTPTPVCPPARRPSQLPPQPGAIACRPLCPRDPSILSTPSASPLPTTPSLAQAPSQGSPDLLLLQTEDGSEGSQRSKSRCPQRSALGPGCRGCSPQHSPCMPDSLLTSLRLRPCQAAGASI